MHDNSSRNQKNSSASHTRKMQTIGTRVATLRAAREISQAALAHEVGVAQPTIANIERGRTKEIKGWVLEALAKALNTTPDFILHGGAEQRNVSAKSQAELIGIWRKLSHAHQDTLLQTARGLLLAEQATPPPQKLGHTKADSTKLS